MPKSSLRSWEQRCQEEDRLSSLRSSLRISLRSSDRRRGWPFLERYHFLYTLSADINCDWFLKICLWSCFLTNQRLWSCFLANRMTEGLYISRSASQKFSLMHRQLTKTDLLLLLRQETASLVYGLNYEENLDCLPLGISGLNYEDNFLACSVDLWTDEISRWETFNIYKKE